MNTVQIWLTLYITMKITSILESSTPICLNLNNKEAAIAGAERKHGSVECDQKSSVLGRVECQ